MKKSFRKAMISTICMLIVGIMSLTGVTYAWFTAGNDATVSQINVNVQDATGSLLIATPASNSTALNFGGSITPVVGTAPLRPVSTTGALSDGVMKFFSAEIGSSTTMLKNVVALENATTEIGSTTYSNWLAFDIYIDNSTGRTEQKVYLASTTSVANDTANKSELASRVAFVQHGYMTLAALDGAALSTENYAGENSTAAVIFEPNAKTHTTAGAADFNAAAAADATSFTQASGKYAYKGINAASSEEVNRYTGSNLAVVSTNEIGAGVAVATVPAESYAKVTVYIWLEGQDHDCLNDIAGFLMKANLKLTIVDPSAA